MGEPLLTAVDLPPGFRFHPTDEEIVTYYLIQKVMDADFTATAIGEADLNKCEPWDLPQKAKMGEKEWYFFCQRDRKYPTGMRTNRATQTGYWKATGKDREIFKGRSVLAGMKKTLVFYKGRAPKGEKTNWVMHEFRLEPKFSHLLHLPRSAKNEWVVCRVFHKNTTITTMAVTKRIQTSDFSSCLPPLMDPSVGCIPSNGRFDNSEVKWKTPEPSQYYLKYISVGANDHYHHQPAGTMLSTMNGAATMIPTTKSYLPSVPDDGFFSFDQLGSSGTTAMTTAGTMECKMEQVSWSMMSGVTQDVSPSIDNGDYETVTMGDLDLWDY